MEFTNWWRKLFHRQNRKPFSKKKSLRRVSARLKLELEALEDRLAPALITVTTLTDEIGVSGQVSLRAAIEAANTGTTVDGAMGSVGANQIQFAPALFPNNTPQNLNITLGSLAITSDITITGPALNLLTINNASGRDFNVTGNPVSPVAAVLQNLTIIGTTTGGGIAVAGAMTSLSVTDCSFSNNTGTSGGAIDNGGSLTVTNSTFANNLATDTGGAIANETGASLQISATTINGNSASSGGGVSLLGGTATIVNSTLNNNLSDTTGFGGGINVAGGTLNLVNDTVTDNTANNPGNGGGGIAVATGSTVNMVNTLVAGNLGGTAPDIAGTVNSLGTNLIGNATGASGLLATDLTGLDPLLSSPGTFGGQTTTFALLPGSPAIDAGQSGTVAGLTIPTTDQRGQPRGAVVDIGAFESQGFTLNPVSGGLQRTLIVTTFDNPLVAAVTPINPLEPVAGGVVTFSAPITGASAVITTPMVIIPSNGTVQTNVQANNNGGSFAVTVGVSGAISASFPLTNQAVTSLSFAQQPTDTRSGAIINQGLTPTGVSVDILDQDGQLIPKAVNAVTMSINTATQLGTDISGLANLGGPNPVLPLPSNSQMVTAIGGVATFPGLTLDKWGDYTLLVQTPPTASGPVQNGVSVPFTITASKLVLSPSNPTIVRSGNNTLSPTDLLLSQFTVSAEAEDVTGDLAKNFTGNVTLSISSATQMVPNDILGQANLQGPNAVANNQQIAAVAGMAVFPQLTLDKWGDYTLAVQTPNTTGGPVDGAVSPTITVTALKLAFVSSPTAVRSGDSFGVVVDAQDVTGDRARNFNGTVTLSLNSAVQVENNNLNLLDPANSKLPTFGGTLTATASGGEAPFSGLNLDRWGNYTLLATTPFVQPPLGGPVDNGISNTIIVTALKLAFITTPSAVRSGNEGLASSTIPNDLQNSQFTVVVDAEDITNDQARNFTGAVTLSIDSAVQVENSNLNLLYPANNKLPTFGGTLTVNAIAGESTFNGLLLDRWGNYTLLAHTPLVQPPLGGPVNDAVSNTITVTAYKLAFITTPTAVRSGDSFGAVVDAQDVTGDRARNFNGIVTLSLNSAVQVENNNLNLLDPANNKLPTFGGTLTATASGGEAALSGLNLDRWGNYTLLATTPFVQPPLGGPVDNGVSNTIIITALKLAFITTPSAVRSGNQGLANSTIPNDLQNSQFTVVVDAEDITNDQARNFTGAVTLSIDTAVQVENSNLNLLDPANNKLPTFGGTLTINALAGESTFNGLLLDRWGNYTLLAHTPLVQPPLGGPVNDAVSNTITVTAYKLAFITTPTAVRSGDSFGAVVDAQDVTGDRARNFNGTVTLSLNSAVQVENNNLNLLDPANHKTPNFGGTLTVIASAGEVSFSGLNLDRWGNYTLLAGTPFLQPPLGGPVDNGVSNTIIVTARMLQFLPTNPTQVRSGNEGLASSKIPNDLKNSQFRMVVDAEDITGDRARNFTGAVTLSIDLAAQVENGNLNLLNPANNKLPTFGGTLTVNALAGESTFNGLLLDRWGNYTLLAHTPFVQPPLGGPVNDAVSNTIVVNAYQLVVFPPPQAQVGQTTGGLQAVFLIKGKQIPFAPIQQQPLTISSPQFKTTVWAVDVTVPTNTLVNQFVAIDTQHFSKGTDPTADLNALRIANAALNFNSNVTLSILDPNNPNGPPLQTDPQAINGQAIITVTLGPNIRSFLIQAASTGNGIAPAPDSNTFPPSNGTVSQANQIKLLVGIRRDDPPAGAGTGNTALNPGIPTYDLTNNGTFTRTDARGTVVLDNGVASIVPAGSKIYDLEETGQLWSYDGSAWSLVDVGVATFGVDSAGTNLFILESNGNLRSYQPSTKTLTVTPLATSITALSVTGSGTAYFLDSSGNLKMISAGTTATIDSGVASFQLDGNGNLYELLSNGNLYQTNSLTIPLATNVKSFQVAADNTLFYLDSLGTLTHQGAGTLDTGVANFTLSSDGSIYELKTNAVLNQIVGANTKRLDTGVQSFVVNESGILYELENSGALWQHSVNGWSKMDVGVKTILQDNLGRLYDLKQNGNLWLYQGTSWSMIDQGAQTIALDPDNTLVDLKNSASLWIYAAGKWNRLDTQVTSFTSTGNQLSVIDAGGSRSFTI